MTKKIIQSSVRQFIHFVVGTFVGSKRGVIVKRSNEKNIFSFTFLEIKPFQPQDWSFFLISNK